MAFPVTLRMKGCRFSQYFSKSSIPKECLKGIKLTVLLITLNTSLRRQALKWRSLGCRSLYLSFSRISSHSACKSKRLAEGVDGGDWFRDKAWKIILPCWSTPKPHLTRGIDKSQSENGPLNCYSFRLGLRWPLLKSEKMYWLSFLAYVTNTEFGVTPTPVCGRSVLFCCHL